MNRMSKAVRMGRHLLAYRRRVETMTLPPLRLWIESTSACNLRCVMCPNKDLPASEKGMMSMALFRKIIDDAREFIGDLYLHHRGEPFLDRDIFDMIKYAETAGLKVRFHTNGTLLAEEKAVKLLEANPSLVSFSIDGFEKKAYERVRVGATFETTLDNIFRLLELRRKKGARTPYIVIEKINFKEEPGLEEQAQARELWRRFLEAGADEVVEKEEYVWAELSAPNIAGKQKLTACTFPWYAMVVCWNGIVTPCPQDFGAVLKMGDANKSSLMEIWNGEEYRKLRRQMAGMTDLHELCRKCDRLCRKTMAGLPLQYMVTFLVDQLVGYNWLRKMIGTSERNK